MKPQFSKRIIKLWSVWRISFISETVSKHWPQTGHEEHKLCSGHMREDRWNLRLRSELWGIIYWHKHTSCTLFWNLWLLPNCTFGPFSCWNWKPSSLKTEYAIFCFLWKVDSTCWGKLIDYVEKFMLCVCSVMSLQPCGCWPSRLICPFNFPGRTLEQVVTSCSRGSSQPRHWLAGDSLPLCHLRRPIFFGG